jgi:WD40-like Beta Propeller Repeat
MKPIERVALLCALMAVADACASDKHLVGPAGAKPLAADVAAGDAPVYGPWGPPVNLGPVVNSAYNDNSPAISKDGLSLYITSSALPSPPGSRPGGQGGADIWVSQRASIDAPWGEPVDLGANINSAGNDGVPSLSTDGHRLYFHSGGRGGCGAADLFVSRRQDKRDDFGWEPAENLGCVVNSPFLDNGPTIFEDDATGITTLYFNSPRPGGLGGVDIYASTLQADGTFGPGVNVLELNSGFNDDRVAIRPDGLEIFVSTNRPGGVGSQDIWVATRATTLDPWSPPVPLGPVVNSPSFDGGPALSFDGTELYFHSDRPGGFGGYDLYVTRRARLRGPDMAGNARNSATDR